jgi:CBS domain containing-hemolysin-like protein
VSVAIALVVVVVLTAFTALYVAAEFATVGVRQSRVAQLADEGHPVARRLLPIISDSHRLDRYIAASQIGITLSGLILGAYGQSRLGDGLGALLERTGWTAAAAASTGTVVTLLALTAFNVVFGELVPKSLALQFPTQVSLWLYWPMTASLAVFRWFIGLLNGSGLIILRLLGVQSADGHRHIHSPDEISMLIAESKDGGLLDAEEEHRLSQALQLGRRTAKQLMVPRRFIHAIEASSDGAAILAWAIDSPFTRAPVYRGQIDECIGFIQTKDVAARFVGQGNADGWQDLIKPITIVPSTLTADRIVAELRARRARLAIVLDEYGGVDGLVTLEDILSELVGGVADEFKADEARPEPLPDGRVRLPGTLRLDEAAEWLGVEWADDKADTVGGRVLVALGTVPDGGERLTIDGVEVEVERMDGPAIRSLIVRPWPGAEGSA